MEERNDERQDAMNGKTIIDPDRLPPSWTGRAARAVRSVICSLSRFTPHFIRRARETYFISQGRQDVPQRREKDHIHHFLLMCRLLLQN
jgi:hypothetical protein